MWPQWPQQSIRPPKLSTCPSLRLGQYLTFPLGRYRTDPLCQVHTHSLTAAESQPKLVVVNATTEPWTIIRSISLGPRDILIMEYAFFDPVHQRVWVLAMRVDKSTAEPGSEYLWSVDPATNIYEKIELDSFLPPYTIGRLVGFNFCTPPLLTNEMQGSHRRCSTQRRGGLCYRSSSISETVRCSSFY